MDRRRPIASVTATPVSNVLKLEFWLSRKPVTATAVPSKLLLRDQISASPASRTRRKFRLSLGSRLRRTQVVSTLNWKGTAHRELTYAAAPPTSVRSSWFRNVGPKTRLCSVGWLGSKLKGPGSSQRPGASNGDSSPPSLYPYM